MRKMLKRILALVLATLIVALMFFCESSVPEAQPPHKQRAFSGTPPQAWPAFVIWAGILLLWGFDCNPNQSCPRAKVDRESIARRRRQLRERTFGDYPYLN